MQSVALSPGPPLQAVKSLLASANLPSSDLTESHRPDFYYAGDADAPTGLVGLEIFGEVALLRSLVVGEAQRGQGLGARLLRHAEAQARAQGVRRMFLLTTTAAPFFARHGYSHAAREAAPPAIRATSEFTGLCPATATFMTRTL